MTGDIRAAIIGLVGFAAAEEQMLLATCAVYEAGDPARWAAVPLVAHNTEFKLQQVHRLEAITLGRAPSEFAEIDHSSDEVYGRYAAQPADQVAAESCRVSGDLVRSLSLIEDADLTDPARHAWLRGRQLWLQVIVRGFWHPTGHIAEYYLRHGQPDRAMALQSHALATARYLGAPDAARGMAAYGLACAQAQAGRADEAAGTLATAVALNPDLRVNACRDPDLSALRENGTLAKILAR